MVSHKIQSSQSALLLYGSMASHSNVSIYSSTRLQVYINFVELIVTELNNLCFDCLEWLHKWPTENQD